MQSVFMTSVIAIAIATIASALDTNILIPLYVYPTPGVWDPIFTSIENHPSLQFQIILNPDSGPGSSSSVGYDLNWINATSILNSFHNVQTFGYVHLLNGAEPTQNVETDITAWAAWRSYGQADLAVSGVFFDETPAADASTMQALTDFAHAQFGSKAKIIFNPGTVPDTKYFSMADHVIVSEVMARDYSTSIPYTSVPSEFASKSSILVYEFIAEGGTHRQLRSWLEGMVDAGIGSINVVDYGWDASNTEDGPADVDSVADLLVEADGDWDRRRSVLAVLLSRAAAMVSMAW